MKIRAMSHLRIIVQSLVVLLASIHPSLAQTEPVAIDNQNDFYIHAAKNILLVKPQRLVIEDSESPILKAFIELGDVKKPITLQTLADKLDTKIAFRLHSPARRPLGDTYPAIGALLPMGRPARAYVVEAVASKQRSESFQSLAAYVIKGLTDFRSNEPTRYFLFKQAEGYDDKAKRLRQWAEKLPYGEMPTKAMLDAGPVAARDIAPQPDPTKETEREAAIQRLARIFESIDILTDKDVQWTQDEDRQKVFAALDELIQLDAIDEGEAGQEMANMIGFLFAAKAPEPPLPVGEFNPAFPPDPPIVPPHPIKPLVYPPVPKGSTKTETYFPAVPKLIAMGPRIAPFIAEAMADPNNHLQYRQNAVYALRRILGSDDAVKKLLLEHAEINEKKALRLRELRDSIPAL